MSTSNKDRNFWAGGHSELLQRVEKLAELHPLALNYKILITTEIFKVRTDKLTYKLELCLSFSSIIYDMIKTKLM